MQTIMIGILEDLSSLRSGDEKILLTTIKATSALDPGLRPVADLREMEGLVAVVKGFLSGEVLFDAEVIEILPPVASGITKDLLQEAVLSIDDLQQRTAAALAGVQGEPEPPPPVPRKKCALVVGHRPGAQGAANEARGLTEFAFNNTLAPEIRNRVTKAAVEIVYRDDDHGGYSRLPGKINALQPHFIISLHCNAAASRLATGTETLYFHRSKIGQKMARALQRHLVDALGLKNRFTKARNEQDRGGILLRHTAAPCVIAEPFFMSNENDMATALARRDRLIQAYAAAIDEIAETVV